MAQCKLLVFNKGNDHPDPRLDWTKFKPGDVIDAQSNVDFDWGSDISKLGWWTEVIVSDADVDDDSIQALLGSEILKYQAPPNAPRKLRCNSVNLVTLRAAPDMAASKARSALKSMAAKGEVVVEEAAVDVIVTTVGKVLANVTLKPATAPTGLNEPTP